MKKENNDQGRYEYLIGLLRKAVNEHPQYLRFMEGDGGCAVCDGYPMVVDGKYQPTHKKSCPVPELISLIGGEYEYAIYKPQKIDASFDRPTHRLSDEDAAIEATRAKLRGHA